MTGNAVSHIDVPLRRAPFDVPGKPDKYYVAIRILHAAADPDSDGNVAGHACQVDTGSCGIVIPMSLLFVDGEYVLSPSVPDQPIRNFVSGTLLPGVTMQDPAEVVYQPSSDSLYGFHFTVERLAVGVRPDGSCAYVAENVQIIGAYNVDSTQGMMGVGFGRNSLGTNVFLNAPGMADGTVPASFLFTPTGIQLGCSRSTLPSADNYTFGSLTWTGSDSDAAIPKNSTDWSTPSCTIEVISGSSSTSEPQTGSALLDTGLTLAMLRLAGDWQTGLVGSTIVIKWLSGPSGVAVFTFSAEVAANASVPTGLNTSRAGYELKPAGNTSAVPKYLIPLGASSSEPVFVNTSIDVIRNANFYFNAWDDTAGSAIFGFSPVS